MLRKKKAFENYDFIVWIIKLELNYYHRIIIIYSDMKMVRKVLFSRFCIIYWIANALENTASHIAIGVSSYRA